MRLKMRICCALCAALMALLPVAALAAFNNYSLDVEALKAVEATDAFEVRITGKSVTDGAGSDYSNPDILTLNVHNDLAAPVTQITILLVAYDDAGTAQNLHGGLSSISIGSVKRELTTLSFDDVSIPAGGELPLNIECQHSNFTGVRALVVQAVTADGEFTNPLYEQWQEVALGSPTHILD